MILEALIILQQFVNLITQFTSGAVLPRAYDHADRPKLLEELWSDRLKMTEYELCTALDLYDEAEYSAFLAQIMETNTYQRVPRGNGYTILRASKY